MPGRQRAKGAGTGSSNWHLSAIVENKTRVLSKVFKGSNVSQALRCEMDKSFSGRLGVCSVRERTPTACVLQFSMSLSDECH